MPDLPQERQAHALGRAASIRAATSPAPTATRCTSAKDPVLTKATQPEVCFACHKEQRAQTHRVSTHPIDAGKMACSDCHNPHGSTGPKLLVKNNVNETCYTCHAEKRGPFLWEHGPVIDDCTNLPYAARLEHPPALEDAAALPLSGMP